MGRVAPCILNFLSGAHVPLRPALACGSEVTGEGQVPLGPCGVLCLPGHCGPRATWRLGVCGQVPGWEGQPLTLQSLGAESHTFSQEQEPGAWSVLGSPSGV